MEDITLIVNSGQNKIFSNRTGPYFRSHKIFNSNVSSNSSDQIMERVGSKNLRSHTNKI